MSGGKQDINPAVHNDDDAHDHDDHDNENDHDYDVHNIEITDQHQLGVSNINPAGYNDNDAQDHDHDDHGSDSEYDDHDNEDDHQNNKSFLAWSVQREARYQFSWLGTAGRHPVSRSS